MIFDVREVLLASLRADLLDELDSGTLVMDEAVANRRSLLHAEHALDAALARGAALNGVIEILDAELHRLGERSSLGLLDAGVSDETLVLDSNPYAGPEYTGMTLGAVKHEIAVHALVAISCVLAEAGMYAIAHEAKRRMAARRLPRHTPVAAVLSEQERRDVYAVAIATLDGKPFANEDDA